jgi:hypothetical protein
MLQASHMTYEQATNFLSSMGMDAELEPHTEEVTRTTMEYTPAPMKAESI